MTGTPFGESSRGNTIRSNRTESLWEEICLWEGLWEDLWKPLKNLLKPLKTSENLSKPLKTSKNLSKISENPPSQRPSQRQISSQRLSVLLPLFCCPLNSLRPFSKNPFLDALWLSGSLQLRVQSCGWEPRGLSHVFVLRPVLKGFRTTTKGQNCFSTFVHFSHLSSHIVRVFQISARSFSKKQGVLDEWSKGSWTNENTWKRPNHFARLLLHVCPRISNQSLHPTSASLILHVWPCWTAASQGTPQAGVDGSHAVAQGRAPDFYTLPRPPPPTLKIPFQGWGMYKKGAHTISAAGALKAYNPTPLPWKIPYVQKCLEGGGGIQSLPGRQLKQPPEGVCSLASQNIAVAEKLLRFQIADVQSQASLQVAQTKKHTRKLALLTSGFGGVFKKT